MRWFPWLIKRRMFERQMQEYKLACFMALNTLTWFLGNSSCLQSHSWFPEMGVGWGSRTAQDGQKIGSKWLWLVIIYFFCCFREEFCLSFTELYKKDDIFQHSLAWRTCWHSLYYYNFILYLQLYMLPYFFPRLDCTKICSKFWEADGMFFYWFASLLENKFLKEW